MRRSLLSLLIGATLLAGIPAQAFWQSRDSNYNISVASGATYVGPGDIVSGATAWYGLRAYNAAYATGSNNAINVRRASDNTTSNIVILANGNLDIATANAFAGVDATASATATASTTLNLTGATPHVGSTITGTGVTQPCYIVSVGSFAGGTGTVVVNAAQTLAAVSISMQYGLYVTEAYDQTGNGNHFIQATASKQPQLLPNCGTAISSLPCLYFASASSQGLVTAATIPTVSMPWLFYGVAYKISGSGEMEIFAQTSSRDAGFSGTSGSCEFYSGTGGSVAIATVTGCPAAAWIQYDFNYNTASSNAYINGTSTAAANISTNGSASAASIGQYFSGSNYLNGYEAAGGFWPLGWSSAVQKSVCQQDSSYYSLGLTCN